VSLLNGAEGVVREFNMILSERCTVMSQSQDCGPGIWWTVNNVFMAVITEVWEDHVVDGFTNALMRIADFFLPKVKDMACSW
jgi:hypothetical protein